MRLAPWLLIATAATAAEYRVLDPLAVPPFGDATAAVITATPPRHVPRTACDVVVLGGGMGGVAAARAAVQSGARVCLTEPTKWLGGQMTSQGVSALDENRFIETTGATASYAELRRRIRAGSGGQANPGQCWVSALCFEPQAGLTAIQEMLPSAVRVFLRTAPVAVTRHGTSIRSVLVYSFERRLFTELTGAVFIDATELGDLLPLSGAAFRTGAESRAQTGELDAPEAADPLSLQSFTYPFILAHGTTGAPIAKPPTYDRDRARYTLLHEYAGGRFLQYGMFDKLPGTPGSFWSYRRLNAAADLSMINWPGNDVCDARYLSADPAEAARALQHGKQVALGFAWWLAQEAPPMTLRLDLLGTADGLSQYPYIRESRRLESVRVVREQDIAGPPSEGVRATQFADSAGIGLYPIDIHGCGKPQRLPASKPFQIPFGALVSKDVDNLLAGGKNIGATHITNGAYRLHPTEWAIGEAAGVLAAEAARQHRTPAALHRDAAALRAVQKRLIDAGHPLVWFDDIGPADSGFAAAQWDAVTGARPLDNSTLHGKH
jgi:hypothetical protein